MTLLDRVATAPISWGICEVPGWGFQLPVERVLQEMAEVGFTHTELGALGFLPTDPAQLRSVLDEHGLELLGGFVPLALHDEGRLDDTRAEAHEAAALIAEGGGRFFVTCPVASHEEWRPGPLVDEQAWSTLYRSLGEVDELVATHGLEQVVHPHYGSVLETDAETRRVLDETGVSIVLDTAHLTLGGTDVLELIAAHGERIGLVHVKDVDDDVAAELTAGNLSLMQAVQRGIFPPLGRGGVPIAEIVARLEQQGRDLWYVLEQDAAIAEGDPAALDGPRLGALESIEYLRALEPVLAGDGARPSRQLQEG